MTNQRAIILLAQMYLPAFDEEEKGAITRAIEALTEQELLKADQTYLQEMQERLQLIADISIDYDGYRTADELKSLIDELRDIALNGVPKKEGEDDA